MPADITQKIEIVEVVQPFGVIKHQRAIWRIVMAQGGGASADGADQAIADAKTYLEGL